MKAAQRIKKPRGLNRGTTTYRKPEWHFRELLHALGTETEISDKLVMRGYPRVPPNSIFGWARRNTVPTIWLPVILQMGREAEFFEQIEELRIL